MKPELRRRLLLFGFTLALVGGLVWNARGALAPFFAGLVLAYIIQPVVVRVQRALPARLRRQRHARFMAVVAVYLAALGLSGAVVMALLPPILAQLSELVASLPQIYKRASELASEVMVAYDRAIFALAGREDVGSEAQAAVEALTSPENLRRLTQNILTQAPEQLGATLDALTATVSWIVALVIIPFWMIYILNDTGRMIDGALSLVPRHVRPDVEAVRLIVDQILGAYIRGQAIIAAIFGSLTTLALLAIGVPYALLIGMAAGLLNLVPFVGAILGAAAGTIMALLISPGLAVKTFIVFVILQQIDNIFVTPRVQGESVALHPALIIITLVLAQQLIGPIGLLVGVPITAVLRDILHYAYLRVADEPPSAAQALATVGYPEAVAKMRIPIGPHA